MPNAVTLIRSDRLTSAAQYAYAATAPAEARLVEIEAVAAVMD